VDWKFGQYPFFLDAKKNDLAHLPRSCTSVSVEVSTTEAFSGHVLPCYAR